MWLKALFYSQIFRDNLVNQKLYIHSSLKNQIKLTPEKGNKTLKELENYISILIEIEKAHAQIKHS